MKPYIIQGYCRVFVFCFHVILFKIFIYLGIFMIYSKCYCLNVCFCLQNMYQKVRVYVFEDKNIKIFVDKTWYFLNEVYR